MEQKQVTTIEKTGKGWKLAQLIGGLLIFGGIIGLVVAFSLASSASPQGMTEGEGASVGVIGLLSVVALPTGLVTWITARLGAWWCHG